MSTQTKEERECKMELSNKLEAALNEQIREEMASAYIYLSMAAYFESANLGGFATWMKAQSNEELEHAMKFYEFIYDRGGRVIFEALEQPPTEFEGPVDVFEKTLAHEQYITGRIHKLFAQAVEEKDFASQGLLQWFVDEQVEEEKTAGDILEMLKMVGDKGHALFMIDRQMGARGG
jgi:ferritin